MHKEKEHYTIIWGDPCYHHFVQTVSAHNEQEALKTWEASFKKKTTVYPFSEKEYQAIAEGFSARDELVQLDEEVAKALGLRPFSDLSNGEPSTNAWSQFFCYTFPTIKNPYLLHFVIKNNKKATEKTRGIFTFVLYYHSGVHFTQYKVSTIEEALTRWQETILEKNLSLFSSSRAVKRFESAMIKGATLSPVVAHPGVWRFQTIIEGHPTTLYVVATASQESAALPDKKSAAITAGQGLYALKVDTDDKQKRISLFEKAAQEGNPLAYYALGRHYFDGKSKKKDFAKAIKCFEKANQANIPAASYYLALCYEEGKGVVQDLGRAYALSLKSALLGDNYAIEDMARLCFRGIGTEADEEVAEVWDQYADSLGIFLQN